MVSIEDTRTIAPYGQLGSNSESSHSSSSGSSREGLVPDSGCGRSCCRCLVSVPCSALMCWLLTNISVATCGGALMVAARRTIDLFNVTDEILPHDTICLSVIFGMLGLVTILLTAATFTSRAMSSNFLGSSKQTSCVQAWLVIAMLLLLVVLVAWIGVVLALAYPVAIFIMVYTRYHRGETCVDIQPYLLTTSEQLYCNGALKRFYEQSEPAFECYLIAEVGAILTVISIVFYLMYTAANFIQIKEMLPSQYNIYKNDVSKHPGSSVLDTRM